MSRDPNITVNERLVRAARRWAALSTLDAPLSDAVVSETVRRVGELEDAVRAYEKHHGMHPIQIRAVPHPARGKTKPKKGTSK